VSCTKKCKYTVSLSWVHSDLDSYDEYDDKCGHLDDWSTDEESGDEDAKFNSEDLSDEESSDDENAKTRVSTDLTISVHTPTNTTRP
jgi:hypothetical protein